MLHLGKLAFACLLLGCKMEEEPRQIWNAVNLMHVLGFPLREGGRRDGIKEEEEDNNRAITNVEPKSGDMCNDGCHGRLLVTIIELQDPPPSMGGIGRSRRCWC
jgi:hypothetical protein